MRAVLLATSAGAEALLQPNKSAGLATPETVLGRLRRQLARFGITQLTLIGRPELMPGLPLDDIKVLTSPSAAEDLRMLAQVVEGDEAVLLASADALLADTVVSSVLSDPTERSGALIGPLDDARPLEAPVRRDRGMVLSVRTGFHVANGANGVVSGLIKISSPYMDDLRAALRQAVADDITDLTGDTDAFTLTLLSLVRRGTKLNAYGVPGIPYGRVSDQAQADDLAQRIADCDEDAVRLKLCVKADDDLFATYSISSYSRVLVKFFAKIKATPVIVTWLSILMALVGAGLFAQASRPALIFGALAIYVSFTLDCVDGQLARYTHQFSNFGGWLDMIADRAKEYLLYAGLAWGAAEHGQTWAWPLAIAAITVQVVRHMTDTWYGTMQDAATLRQATRPLLSAEDGFAPAAGGGGGSSLAVRVGRKLGALSAQFTSQRRSGAYWFKRTIVFPVGERWLVMGLGAAIFDGRIALAALLTGQLIAFGYTLAGRTLRSWAAKVPVLARQDVSTHRDDGLLVRLTGLGALPPLPVVGVGLLVGMVVLGTYLANPGGGTALAVVAIIAFLPTVFTAGHRHGGPLDWLIPAGLRAAEYLLVITCGVAGNVPLPLIFGLLSALALFHYDLAAKIDKAASPMDSRVFGLGWDGRTMVLLLSLIPGWSVWIFTALTAWMALVFLGGALIGRSRTARAEKRARTAASVWAA